MGSLSSYLNSGLGYAKSGLELLVQAGAAAAGSITTGRLIHASGIGRPITIVSKSVSFLAKPLLRSSRIVEDVLSYIVPPIYYFSRHNLPNVTTDDCFRVASNPPLYKCKLFNPVLLSGLHEEILYRGLVQRKVLPWIADRLPSSFGNILKDKISRVLIASLIFAGAHGTSNDSSFHFASGLVYGMIAEANQSLKIPILSHVLSNGYIMYLLAKSET